MTIGDMILRTRQMKGDGQDVIAKMCGVTLKTISLWENNKNIPRYKYFSALKAYCGVSDQDWNEGRLPEPSINATATEDAVMNTQSSGRVICIPVCGKLHTGPLSVLSHSSAQDWKQGVHGDLNSIILIVDGHSLEPDFKPGDQVFFEQCVVSAIDVGNGLYRINQEHFERINNKLCLTTFRGKKMMARVIRFESSQPGQDSKVSVSIPNSNTWEPSIGEFVVTGIATRLVRILN